MTIEGREPRGGQRLVDWSPVLHPVEAPGGGACKLRQANGEAGVQKVGVTGTGAVVGQPKDGPNVQRPHARQPLIDPLPVLRPSGYRRHALP